MALLTNGPDDHADQLTLLTERISVLMAQERALLDAQDYQAAATRTEEIGRLSGVYRVETQRIAEQPGLIEAAASDLKDKLRIATERFRQNLVEHEAFLAAARRLTEGLVRAVAEEVARSKPSPMGYGANGRTATLKSSLAVNALA